MNVETCCLLICFIFVWLEFNTQEKKTKQDGDQD